MHDELRARIARGRAAIAAATSRGETATEWELHLRGLQADLAAVTLPPVHDAASFDEPTPVLPCRACGGRRWRLWADDPDADDPDADDPRWQRYCCTCNPLTIKNPDGSLWRDGSIIRAKPAGAGGEA